MLYRMIALCIFAPLAVSAATTISYEAKTPEGSFELNTSGDSRGIRMEIATRSPREVIYKGEKNSLLVISPREKVYYVLDEETVRIIDAAVSEALEKLLGPTRGQGHGSPIDTGIVTEVNGYVSVQIDVQGDLGRRIASVWVAADDALDVDFDIEGYLRLLALVGGRDVVPPLPELETMIRMGYERSIITRAVEYGDDGSVERSLELRRIHDFEAMAEGLEPPSGYKRKTLAGAKASSGSGSLVNSASEGASE